MARLKKTYMDKTVLLVSHGGIFNLLAIALFEMPLCQFMTMYMDCCAISELDVGPDFCRIGVWNQTSHLE